MGAKAEVYHVCLMFFSVVALIKKVDTLLYVVCIFWEEFKKVFLGLMHLNFCP